MPKGTPTPTHTIVHRLRIMADAGGMLTRDRIATVIDAADRLEFLDERVAIQTEQDFTATDVIFPPKGDSTNG